MPSGAIGNGVKINHIFVEGGALEHGGGDDDDSDDSGGIYIFGGGVLFAELSIYIIFILYI